MSESKKFGRLDKLDIRQYWRNEASDFTPWLASDENIALLGDALGIGLEVEQTEKDVGSFKLDILCKDTENDRTVIVENQLERTDHTHLGQLLTYAAGLKASTVVWIADDFTDEHRAALDWLNEQTGEEIHLFGVEIEVWRIGNSEAAPRFDVVAKPNDWTKTARADRSAGKQLRWEFWSGLLNLMKSNRVKIGIRQNPVQTYTKRFDIEGKGIRLQAVCRDKMRVALWIMGDKHLFRYRQLHQNKAVIEQEIGATLDWREKPNKNRKLSIIRLFAESGALKNKDDWSQLHEWMMIHLEKFRATFESRIATIDEADDEDGD